MIWRLHRAYRIISFIFADNRKFSRNNLCIPSKFHFWQKFIEFIFRNKILFDSIYILCTFSYDKFRILFTLILKKTLFDRNLQILYMQKQCKYIMQIMQKAIKICWLEQFIFIASKFHMGSIDNWLYDSQNECKCISHMKAF